MGNADRAGRFGAVVTAMVTPFEDDGSLDIDGAVRLSRWLTGHGSDALVIAGTTGEGAALSDAEMSDLWRAVSQTVTVPVVAGTGTSDTRHSMELTRMATEAGVAGILLVTPYYNRPSQQGIFEHFAAVASVTELPVMLYDIPARTGRKISSDTMLRLARSLPNIVGVKDAAGDVVASARLVADAPAGFELYSGDDHFTLPLLSVGAVGAVSVASHWIGDEIGEMISAFRSGDVERARNLNASLADLVAFQSSETNPNPIPAKAMCRALGLPAGQCRLPMGVAPKELEEDARRLLAAAGKEPSSANAGPGEAAVRQLG
ncbi:MAG TPA: 4-hydroxy-tetrahydrodipicolinate synthase [Acidimicrobiales bacterium]|nr:4-hydroxy-tetrahydrodipicolinate synthase [Acidimicrobiales bacterium]